MNPPVAHPFAFTREMPVGRNGDVQAFGNGGRINGGGIGGDGRECGHAKEEQNGRSSGSHKSFPLDKYMSGSEIT